MKKHELQNVGTVFRYTVQQHYKTKSVVIFLVILFVLALLSFPMIYFFNGQDKEVTETQITTLYLRNEAGIPMDESEIRADSRYSALKIENVTDDDDAMKQRVLSEKTAAGAVISLNAEQMHFSIRTVYGQNGDIANKDAKTLNRVLEKALHQSVLKTLSVTEAQEATIRSSVVSQVAKAADYLNGAEETGTDTHVFANLFYCYLIMIVCSLSMGYVFQQCMDEKVSKLVESLLVSVSPTALLAGKCLAVMVFVFGGLGIIALGITLSYFISKSLGITVSADLIQSVMSIDVTSLHLTPKSVILFIVCILLAFSICMGLAGAAGSCCSKTEDTQQASLVVMMFIMIGYMTGAFAPMFERDSVNILFSLFPLTSVFTAFPNYVCGKIGLPVFLLALVLQAATAVLLARLAGRIYRMMVFYRGAVPKPAQVIKMLREEKAAAKHAGKEDSHGA